MAALAKPRKVLLCGDVGGRLEALFKRVVTLNASAAGPFDMVLCCGAFFPQSGESYVKLLFVWMLSI